jgi:hypothetical protein
MLKTKFWKDAANGLPEGVREHYLPDIQQAERWELALGRAIEGWARVKNAFGRTFHTPRGAH